jgi:hypothetical protein
MYEMAGWLPRGAIWINIPFFVPILRPVDRAGQVAFAFAPNQFHDFALSLPMSASISRMSTSATRVLILYWFPVYIVSLAALFRNQFKRSSGILIDTDCIVSPYVLCVCYS